jgi:hypothetical protein
VHRLTGRRVPRVEPFAVRVGLGEQGVDVGEQTGVELA